MDGFHAVDAVEIGLLFVGVLHQECCAQNLLNSSFALFQLLDVVKFEFDGSDFVGLVFEQFAREVQRRNQVGVVHFRLVDAKASADEYPLGFEGIGRIEQVDFAFSFGCIKRYRIYKRTARAQGRSQAYTDAGKLNVVFYGREMTHAYALVDVGETVVIQADTFHQRAGLAVLVAAETKKRIFLLCMIFDLSPEP